MNKAVLVASLMVLSSPAVAERLLVRNNTTVGIRNIQVRDLDTNTYLGDRLVGKIPASTQAYISLSNDNGSCRLRLVAVFYDEDKVVQTFDACRPNQSWTLQERPRVVPENDEMD